MTDRPQAGASAPASHDPYVYRVSGGRRWRWNCPCGAESSTDHLRRMDADEAAENHLRVTP